MHAVPAGRGLERPARSAGPHSLSAAAVAGAALPAAAVAAAALVAGAAAIAEISNEPTAVPGVDSSTWTPITAVATLVLGRDAFHGDFAIGPIVVGGALLVAYAIAAGVLGVALLVYAQGPYAGTAGGALQGLAYGIALQVLAVNLAVNAIQSGPNTVYEALPSWGWWAAHALYGVALGVLGARAVAARARRAPPP